MEYNLAWNNLLIYKTNFIDDFFSENYNVDIFYIITILSVISLLIFSYFNMLKIKIIEKKIDTIIRAESLKDILKKLKD